MNYNYDKMSKCGSARRLYECLYTHQKRQKNKKWKDGYIEFLSTYGITKIALYDSERNCVESYPGNIINFHNIKEEYELVNHLVQINDLKNFVEQDLTENDYGKKRGIVLTEDIESSNKKVKYNYGLQKDAGNTGNTRTEISSKNATNGKNSVSPENETDAAVGKRKYQGRKYSYGSRMSNITQQRLDSNTCIEPYTNIKQFTPPRRISVESKGNITEVLDVHYTDRTNSNVFPNGENKLKSRKGQEREDNCYNGRFDRDFAKENIKKKEGHEIDYDLANDDENKDEYYENYDDEDDEEDDEELSLETRLSMVNVLYTTKGKYKKDDTIWMDGFILNKEDVVEFYSDTRKHLYTLKKDNVRKETEGYILFGKYLIYDTFTEEFNIPVKVKRKDNRSTGPITAVKKKKNENIIHNIKKTDDAVRMTVNTLTQPSNRNPCSLLKSEDKKDERVNVKPTETTDDKNRNPNEHPTNKIEVKESKPIQQIKGILINKNTVPVQTNCVNQRSTYSGEKEKPKNELLLHSDKTSEIYLLTKNIENEKHKDEGKNKIKGFTEEGNKDINEKMNKNTNKGLGRNGNGNGFGSGSNRKQGGAARRKEILNKYIAQSLDIGQVAMENRFVHINLDMVSNAPARILWQRYSDALRIYNRRKRRNRILRHLYSRKKRNLHVRQNSNINVETSEHATNDNTLENTEPNERIISSSSSSSSSSPENADDSAFNKIDTAETGNKENNINPGIGRCNRNNSSDDNRSNSRNRCSSNSSCSSFSSISSSDNSLINAIDTQDELEKIKNKKNFITDEDILNVDSWRNKHNEDIYKVEDISQFEKINKFFSMEYIDYVDYNNIFLPIFIFIPKDKETVKKKLSFITYYRIPNMFKTPLDYIVRFINAFLFQIYFDVYKKMFVYYDIFSYSFKCVSAQSGINSNCNSHSSRSNASAIFDHIIKRYDVDNFNGGICIFSPSPKRFKGENGGISTSANRETSFCWNTSTPRSQKGLDGSGRSNFNSSNCPYGARESKYRSRSDDSFLLVPDVKIIWSEQTPNEKYCSPDRFFIKFSDGENLLFAENNRMHKTKELNNLIGTNHIILLSKTNSFIDCTDLLMFVSKWSFIRNGHLEIYPLNNETYEYMNTIFKEVKATPSEAYVYFLGKHKSVFFPYAFFFIKISEYFENIKYLLYLYKTLRKVTLYNNCVQNNHKSASDTLKYVSLQNSNKGIWEEQLTPLKKKNEVNTQKKWNETPLHSANTCDNSTDWNFVFSKLGVVRCLSQWSDYKVPLKNVPFSYKKQFIEDINKDTRLNEKQKEVLHRVVNWFLYTSNIKNKTAEPQDDSIEFLKGCDIDDNADDGGILINGIFGSGKSTLICKTILSLNEILSKEEEMENRKGRPRHNVKKENMDMEKEEEKEGEREKLKREVEENVIDLTREDVQNLVTVNTATSTNINNSNNVIKNSDGSNDPNNVTTGEMEYEYSDHVHCKSNNCAKILLVCNTNLAVDNILLKLKLNYQFYNFARIGNIFEINCFLVTNFVSLNAKESKDNNDMDTYIDGLLRQGEATESLFHKGKIENKTLNNINTANNKNNMFHESFGAQKNSIAYRYSTQYYDYIDSMNEESIHKIRQHESLVDVLRRRKEFFLNTQYKDRRVLAGTSKGISICQKLNSIRSTIQYLIVDESTQLDEISILKFFMKFPLKKFIFIGDVKQLSFVLKGNSDLKRSMFGRLVENELYLSYYLKKYRKLYEKEGRGGLREDVTVPKVVNHMMKRYNRLSNADFLKLKNSIYYEMFKPTTTVPYYKKDNELATVKEYIHINRLIILNMQYRCHPHISDICSHLFYNNNILNGTKTKHMNLLYPKCEGHLNLIIIKRKVTEVKYNSSYANPVEAKIILNMCSEMIDANIDAETIGIISLFKYQVSHIKNTMKNLKNYDKLKKIKVATVDSFQGIEKDIIFLSCVLTLSENAKKNEIKGKEEETPKSATETKKRKQVRFNMSDADADADASTHHTNTDVDDDTAENGCDEIEEKAKEKSVIRLINEEEEDTFFENKNRINVALSRAKNQLIIVAHNDFIQNSSMWRYIKSKSIVQIFE